MNVKISELKPKTMQVCIVDAQNDFINGSMAVKGAEEKVNNIIKFLKEHADKIDTIVVTLDWHPYDHCSFKENGGKWPRHCVKYTEGAALYQPLADTIGELASNNDIDVYYVKKGSNKFEEEYGAFSGHIDDKQSADCYFFINQPIVTMGFCGDYCVYWTAEHLLNQGYRVKFYLDGIANIDNGETLKMLIELHEERNKLTI